MLKIEISKGKWKTMTKSVKQAFLSDSRTA